jgi:Zn-dependent membrane protease YugP
MHYFYDISSYLIYVVPAIVLTIIAQIAVSVTFKKYSKISVSRNVTGHDAAKRILSNEGVRDVSLSRVQGNLTDHYDPRTKVIGLSESVHDSSSIAAIGVAAHEAGHAIQHSIGYKPLLIRDKLVPVTRFASNMAIPLIIIGFALAFTQLVWIGIIFFGGAVLFQLVTLPVEFNASARALSNLRDGGILDEDEIAGAKKVLSAAALTYVAAMLVSLMQMLRFIVLATGRGRRS